MEGGGGRGGIQCPPLERRWKGALQREAAGAPKPGCAFRPLQAPISILFFPGLLALPPPAGILPFWPIICQRKKKIGFLAQVLFSTYLDKRLDHAGVKWMVRCLPQGSRSWRRHPELGVPKRTPSGSARGGGGGGWLQASVAAFANWGD